MQTEGAVERQRAVGAARRGDRQLTMQAGIVRIPIRGHSRQAVERAAQDHDHQSRRASGMGEHNLRHGGTRGQRPGA